MQGAEHAYNVRHITIFKPHHGTVPLLVPIGSMLPATLH